MKGGNVLLEFEVAIHGYQHLEMALRTAQKFAVLDTLLSHAGDGRDLVTRQLCRPIDRQVLVKKNAHC
ncbi:MAG: hypothetical protein LAP13_12555 [Acidobacteriia bacterium]|nr:hypothetical protein [Terriglobia bacterium]